MAGMAGRASRAGNPDTLRLATSGNREWVISGSPGVLQRSLRGLDRSEIKKQSPVGGPRLKTIDAANVSNVTGGNQ